MKSSFPAEASAIHSGTFSRPQGDALVPYRKIRSFPAFAGLNFSGNSDGLPLRLWRWGSPPAPPRRRDAGPVLAGTSGTTVFVTAQPRPPAERIARVA